jgi:uncharacterized integral membrane protein
MTLPAEDRPPLTPEDDLPPRAPESGWSAHRTDGEAAYRADAETGYGESGYRADGEPGQRTAGETGYRAAGESEPAPLRDDPGAFRDPVTVPTTEAEPIPTPGSTTHGPGTPPGEVGGPGGLTARGGTALRPRMFTRISAAWLGVWAGLLVVVLLIIFIGQNTADVRIRFLWLDGQIPTALALLIAGVGGAIIAMAVAAARIIQLRRLVRRRRD